MNPELVHQIEQLSQSCMQARVGDIGTLADLLEQCDTLRQIGEMQGLAGVAVPAEALGDLIKRMIMGDDEDDAAAMHLLRESVSALQMAVQRGEAPGPDAFPAGLQVPPYPTPAGNGGGAKGAAGPDADDSWDVPLPEPGPATPGPFDQGGGEEGAFAADEELLSEYLTEQRGRLEEIEGHLLTLERAPDEAALADLRRALHTIKGDSGFLGLSAVAQISHAAESYLEAASYPYDLEHLFAVKDWLARAFEDLAGSGRLSRSTQASLRTVLTALGAEPLDAPQAPRDSVPEEGTAADILGEREPEAAPPEMLEVAAEPEAAAELDAAAELGAAAAEPDVGQPAAGGAADLGSELAAEFAAELAAKESTPERDAGFSTGGQSHFELTADQSLLADFITESKEHLDNASAKLLELESNPIGEEAINCVFRAFHTVKGIAGFLALDEIQKLAHDTENLLDMVRRNELELTPPVIDLVFEALDWMTRLIGNVRKGLQGDSRVPYEPELGPFLARVGAALKGRVGPPEKGTRQQRLGELLVEAKAVDRATVEEAVKEVKRGFVDKKLGEALVEKDLVTPSQVHAALRQQAVQGPSGGPRKGVELKETLRVDYERLENMINTIGELVLAEAMISQDDQLVKAHSEGLDKKLYNLRQVSRKLQELGTTIRMVPISGTFQKMARLVRDLSRKSSKPVEFISHGDETELDRAYVDLIADPLVHMIRNAVDHGIEPGGQRRQQGKPDTGRIELRAFHEGGNIHVEVRDDGQGLDVERIFSKAVEKGMVAEDERERMSDQDIFQLIFQPGFSTAAQVTEVSGRGVGMDVVRRNIAELRGQVQITSEHHKGTLFKIILPLTLALIDGMLVRVGQERFIFPVLSVVESTRPTRDMLNTVVGKGEMVSLRGRQLPIYRLNRLFEVPGAKEDVTDALIVVVENEGRQIGVVVDELVGIQQTVIKNLGNGLLETRGLSGGSIMADGTVGLIVDIAGLINIARSRGSGLSGTVN